MTRIVILGLAITSSWGNGHATCYRGLMAALGRRSVDVLFLERERPWYADNRDLPAPPGGTTSIYHSLDELRNRWGDTVAAADLVIVGSYVPEGIAVADWVLDRARGRVAFYDIDTPVTLTRLADDDCDYLSLAQVARYDLYLSFTGGPILRHLEQNLGARRAVELSCAVDLQVHRTAVTAQRFDLGYLGTYSLDRQPLLQQLLLMPAAAWPQGRFAIAGPMFADRGAWPANVEHIEHLAPEDHAAFYCQQRLTLNVTRAPTRRWGYAPSVRLFEAAACGVPVISDRWAGLDQYFTPGREILIADDATAVLRLLRDMPESERLRIGSAARQRVEREHTADHRAETLLGALDAVAAPRAAEGRA